MELSSKQTSVKKNFQIADSNWIFIHPHCKKSDSVRIHNVNSHDNKEKHIEREGDLKLLSGSVCLILHLFEI